MKSIIVKKIHKMIINKTDPSGRIERKKLFRIIAERVGKLEGNDKKLVVLELMSVGVIKDYDKFSFMINKTF